MKTCLTAFAIIVIFGRSVTLAPGSTTISYTHDSAGRLVQADYGREVVITYIYDANGNLLQRAVTDDGAITYTLIYRAGTGGSIDGLPVVTQQVARGESGVTVTAVVEDAGAVFGRWSDGHASATRTDTDAQADLDVTARFRSVGGADLDWYTVRGIAPEGDETSWDDVDARPVPAKGTTLWHENIADTDPEDPEDTFRILTIDRGPPIVITFRPGSSGRVYTLLATDDLVSGVWSNVPGVSPRIGHGGGGGHEDTLGDGNDPPAGPFYRIEVELP